MREIEDMHDFLELFQGPEIDDMEAELTSRGHTGLSVKLNRLSIDAMLDYMAMKTGAVDPESGPQTARLSKGYEPVTLERLALLDELRSVLPDCTVLQDLCAALAQVRAKTPSLTVSENPPSPRL